MTFTQHQKLLIQYKKYYSSCYLRATNPKFYSGYFHDSNLAAVFSIPFGEKTRPHLFSISVLKVNALKNPLQLSGGLKNSIFSHGATPKQTFWWKNFQLLKNKQVYSQTLPVILLKVKAWNKMQLPTPFCSAGKKNHRGRSAGQKEKFVYFQAPAFFLLKKWECCGIFPAGKNTAARLRDANGKRWNRFTIQAVGLQAPVFSYIKNTAAFSVVSKLTTEKAYQHQWNYKSSNSIKNFMIPINENKTITLAKRKRFISNSLKGVLLVNFPEKEKNFLTKNLAAENKIALITQSASLLLKDSRNMDDLLGVDDPIQILFDKVKTCIPCICFINNLDSIGKQRYEQEANSLDWLNNSISLSIDHNSRRQDLAPRGSFKTPAGTNYKKSSIGLQTTSYYHRLPNWLSKTTPVISYNKANQFKAKIFSSPLFTPKGIKNTAAPPLHRDIHKRYFYNLINSPDQDPASQENSMHLPYPTLIGCKLWVLDKTLTNLIPKNFSRCATLHILSSKIKLNPTSRVLKYSQIPLRVEKEGSKIPAGADFNLLASNPKASNLKETRQRFTPQLTQEPKVGTKKSTWTIQTSPLDIDIENTAAGNTEKTRMLLNTNDLDSTKQNIISPVGKQNPAPRRSLIKQKSRSEGGDQITFSLLTSTRMKHNKNNSFKITETDIIKRTALLKFLQILDGFHTPTEKKTVAVIHQIFFSRCTTPFLQFPKTPARGDPKAYSLKMEDKYSRRTGSEFIKNLIAPLAWPKTIKKDPAPRNNSIANKNSMQNNIGFPYGILKTLPKLPKENRSQLDKKHDLNKNQMSFLQFLSKGDNREINTSQFNLVPTGKNLPVLTNPRRGTTRKQADSLLEIFKTRCSYWADILKIPARADNRAMLKRKIPLPRGSLRIFNKITRSRFPEFKKLQETPKYHNYHGAMVSKYPTLQGFNKLNKQQTSFFKKKEFPNQAFKNPWLSDIFLKKEVLKPEDPAPQTNKKITGGMHVKGYEKTRILLNRNIFTPILQTKGVPKWEIDLKNQGSFCGPSNKSLNLLSVWPSYIEDILGPFNLSDSGCYILPEYFQLLGHGPKLKKQGITLIASTNNLTGLDAALLRPGRFDTIINFSHSLSSIDKPFKMLKDSPRGATPYLIQDNRSDLYKLYIREKKQLKVFGWHPSSRIFPLPENKFRSTGKFFRCSYPPDNNFLLALVPSINLSKAIQNRFHSDLTRFDKPNQFSSIQAFIDVSIFIQYKLWWNSNNGKSLSLHVNQKGLAKKQKASVYNSQKSPQGQEFKSSTRSVGTDDIIQIFPSKICKIRDLTYPFISILQTIYLPLQGFFYHLFRVSIILKGSLLDISMEKRHGGVFNFPWQENTAAKLKNQGVAPQLKVNSANSINQNPAGPNFASPLAREVLISRAVTLGLPKTLNSLHSSLRVSFLPTTKTRGTTESSPNEVCSPYNPLQPSGGGFFSQSRCESNIHLEQDDMFLKSNRSLLFCTGDFDYKAYTENNFEISLTSRGARWWEFKNMPLNKKPSLLYYPKMDTLKLKLLGVAPREKKRSTMKNSSNHSTKLLGITTAFLEPFSKIWKPFQAIAFKNVNENNLGLTKYNQIYKLKKIESEQQFFLALHPFTRLMLKRSREMTKSNKSSLRGLKRYFKIPLIKTILPFKKIRCSDPPDTDVFPFDGNKIEMLYHENKKSLREQQNLLAEMPARFINSERESRYSQIYQNLYTAALLIPTHISLLEEESSKIANKDCFFSNYESYLFKKIGTNSSLNITFLQIYSNPNNLKKEIDTSGATINFLQNRLFAHKNPVDNCNGSNIHLTRVKKQFKKIPHAVTPRKTTLSNKQYNFQNLTRIKFSNIKKTDGLTMNNNTGEQPFILLKHSCRDGEFFVSNVKKHDNPTKTRGRSVGKNLFQTSAHTISHLKVSNTIKRLEPHEATRSSELQGGNQWMGIQNSKMYRLDVTFFLLMFYTLFFEKMQHKKNSGFTALNRIKIFMPYKSLIFSYFLLSQSDTYGFSYKNFEILIYNKFKNFLLDRAYDNK